MIPTSNSYLDFNLVEGLALMNTNVSTDHFGDDDHVTEVSLDNSGLLLNGGGSLALAKLLHQGQRLALKTTLEAAASASVEELNELNSKSILTSHFMTLMLTFSVGIATKSSNSTPRKENLRKVRFFLSSAS